MLREHITFSVINPLRLNFIGRNRVCYRGRAKTRGIYNFVVGGILQYRSKLLCGLLSKAGYVLT